MADALSLAPGGVLRCPRLDNEGLFEIDLKGILAAEGREAEVSALTKEKAKELGKHFNWAWREIMQNVAFLRRQRDLAETAMDMAKAKLLLGPVQAILKERGVKDSADARAAVIDLDPEYQKAADQLSQLAAVMAYLEVKAKSFERLHRSCQEVRFSGGWEPSVANPTEARAGGADPYWPNPADRERQVVIAMPAPGPAGEVASAGAFGDAKY